MFQHISHQALRLDQLHTKLFDIVEISTKQNPKSKENRPARNTDNRHDT